MTPANRTTEPDQLLASVPMFALFFRSYQGLDLEARAVVREMATRVEDGLLTQDERDYAAEVIVESLFPRS